MRCHVVYDAKLKAKVLIPGCMAKASNELADCICQTDDELKHENKMLRIELERRGDEIRQLYDRLGRLEIV